MTPLPILSEEPHGNLSAERDLFIDRLTFRRSELHAYMLGGIGGNSFE